MNRKILPGRCSGKRVRRARGGIGDKPSKAKQGGGHSGGGSDGIFALLKNAGENTRKEGGEHHSWEKRRHTAYKNAGPIVPRRIETSKRKHLQGKMKQATPKISAIAVSKKTGKKGKSTRVV